MTLDSSIISRGSRTHYGIVSNPAKSHAKSYTTSWDAAGWNHPPAGAGSAAVRALSVIASP